MTDHIDLEKCGPECILELQEAVMEAETRANDLGVELHEARQYIKDFQDRLLDLRMKLRTAERDLEDYKLAAGAEAGLYDELRKAYDELKETSIDLYAYMKAKQIVTTWQERVWVVHEDQPSHDYGNSILRRMKEALGL